MATDYAAFASDVAAFKHYLLAERGLAKNTILAYGRDLERFQAWAVDGSGIL